MLFVVAVALISQSDEILLQKRPEGRAMAGLWEFPGGKVESGESPESALIREVEEELAIHIRQQDLVPLTFASEPLADRHLTLLLYACRNWTGIPASQEGAELMWTIPAGMRELPMPPADLPFIGHLETYLAR